MSYRFTQPTFLRALLLIGCLYGCQLPQAVPDTTSASSKVVADYSQKARELEAQNSLVEALLHWQIVATVQPDLAEARDSISRIEGKIRVERDYYFDAAKVERAKGNQAEAILYLLNALAVAPDDPEVTTLLQKAKRSQALANFPSQPKKIKSREPEKDNIDEMFELGLSLISTDKAEARRLFELILKIDPSHLAARAYLEVLVED